MEASTVNDHQPRRRGDGEARRGAIVDAALAEFAARGYAGARLDDVARRAGVAKGTIYLYFDSKAALFRGVVEAWLLPGLAHAEAQLADDGRSAEALLADVLFTLYRELVETDAGQVMRLVIAEGARFPEVTSFYFEAVIQRGRRLLAAILEHGRERGEFRTDVPVDHPELIIGPALLAAVWRLVFEPHEPLDRDAFRRAHLQLMLDGLKVRCQ